MLEKHHNVLVRPEVCGIAFIALISFVIALEARADDSSATLLDHFKVEKSESGEAQFFIRRTPIVAAIVGFDESDHTNAAKTMEIFSSTTGQPITFAAQGSNLVLIRTQQVHVGDRVNSELLRKYSFPPLVISAMEETTGWSSECGSYVFKQRTGDISVSVGLVDEKLSGDQQSICVGTIISRSFGYGTGVSTRTVNQIGYFHIALALQMVSRCEQILNSRAANIVGECVNQVARVMWK